jgi:hypothetical protein
MARKRMISPEFWEDTTIASCQPFARLLFIALWNMADDEGYLRNDPLWIKAKCLPYDKISIEQLIKELHEKGRINIKNGIMHVVNFLKHQSLDRPKPSELKPIFESDSTNARRTIDESSPSTRPSRAPAEVEVEVEVEEKGKRKATSSQNPPKQKFGAHCSMSQMEYDVLCSEWGKGLVDDYIERVNDWIDSKGVKPPKNYPATLRNWFKRDGKSKRLSPKEQAEELMRNGQ